MKLHGQMLLGTPLFAGLAADELERLLDCLGAREIRVKKGAFALLAGDMPDHVGIVLTGGMQVVREDASGSRALIASLGPGEMFAESLAAAQVARSTVSVVATEPSSALMLHYQRLIQPCEHACTFHGRVVSNMLGILARKSMGLQARMEILEKKTMRERVMTYLMARQKRCGQAFELALDRNELAEYLAVDRSALSRELARMQGEGLIEYQRNTFRLL